MPGKVKARWRCGQGWLTDPIPPGRLRFWSFASQRSTSSPWRELTEPTQGYIMPFMPWWDNMAVAGRG